MRWMVCLCVLLGAFAGAVLAASSANAYTQEQARLCSGDAFRLCSSYIPNVEQITVCMRKQQSKLSAGCKRVFDKPPALQTSAREL